MTSITGAVALTDKRVRRLVGREDGAHRSLMPLNSALSEVCSSVGSMFER